VTSSASPRRCPDCGAPNPAEAVTCIECNHPLDVPDSAPPSSPVATPDADAPARPVRLDRPERPERVAANVTSWGYHPRGMTGDTSVPSWLWAAVGLGALVAVLVSAIQIARQPPPLAVPGASKPQLASAESLAVLLRADSTAAGPNVALGNLFYDTGNFGEAVPFYLRALRKDPEMIDVRVDLGVSYHNLGKLDLAQQELEEAVRRQPDHAVAQFDLAVVYQTMGRKEDARAHYLKAKSLDTPPDMAAVIDQLLAKLDNPNASALPPGHPSVP
jgi:hypothetical protein